MRKLLGVLIVVGMVFQLFGLVGAYSTGDTIGPWTVQDQRISNYYDGNQWLGRFVAISGSKSVVRDGYIYVTHRVNDPNPISGVSRVSSFAVKEGGSWRTCSWWIFCTTYWPDIRVKTYEEYDFNAKYSYGYRERPTVEYSDVTVITDKGSDISYMNLDPAFRALLDAVASLAGSPIGVSWIFDVFQTKTDSGPVQGLLTSDIKVDLKTGEQWFPYPDNFYADHGLIQSHITLQFGPVYGKRKPGDIDFIDLDSVYTVEAGEYFIGPFMEYPSYLPVKTSKEPLYFINIRLEWTG
ncbi:hypothetical protein [Thermococcus zilligii]|uniref:hypothetical protein n=1 Tax=Thermococcus zilligii TaxID=54076 RepID=UPI00029B50DB|nr:hypothetical protein [Thermococcus zilligii]